ncbi:glycoside hydrolase family 3 C-terminal domain-containing protein [candidate division KSB1 bacterium]|nr:glycoside hydrolase family 3 C-terminal domain-containing protein [candidate division KSB1 bacterium]
MLRDEWNFDGFVLSDWDAVAELIAHGFAADEKEAARRALEAGVDMEMASTTYTTLIEQVQSGQVSPDLIDTAVRRILRIKFRLGLFENPYADPQAEKAAFIKPAYRSFARKTATGTMVLLENDHSVLPIRGNFKSIAVLGPYADSQDLLGWWHCLGDQNNAISVLQGMRKEAPESIKGTNEIDWNTDLILLCVGEESYFFGENNNRADIKLPHELSAKGLPIVLVIFNGRPLDLTGVEKLVDAMIVAWHPGLEAGPALADLVFGGTNFCAKLTTTFPASVAHIPVFYNHRNSGRPASNRYWDATPDPHFPFG